MILGFMVGLTVHPAAEEDADPFEGEGANGGVMSFAALALVGVKGFGPRGLLGGEVRPIRRRSDGGRWDRSGAR